MKKLILFILLMLISLICIGQMNQNQYIQKGILYYPQPETVTTMNITLNPIQNGWGQLGNTCAGCASFYYQILRTTGVHMAEDGNYYYFFYVYFFSNSYYNNGQTASTYLTNIVYSGNNRVVLQTPYLLLKAGVQEFGAWIRSSDPQCYIQFNVDKITVY